MKRTFFIICWILLSQVLFVACSGFDDKSPIDIEKDYANQQILLTAPGVFNSFNTADPIYLELSSNSNNEIVFPNDYNLRIFEKKAGDWVEIFEIPTTRLPAGEVVFSPNKKLRETTFTDPDLVDYSRRYQLRIYVIGEMKTETGIKKVAAFTDVKLHPNSFLNSFLNWFLLQKCSLPRPLQSNAMGQRLEKISANPRNPWQKIISKIQLFCIS